MKHIDYLYFNIYNYFYRSSLFQQNFNARIQTMYLFSLGSGGWLLLLETLYLLTTVFFNYIFIVKDRDQQIFGKYEELSNQNPKRKIHLIISISVLLIPYLALLALAVFSPRHVQ